MWSRVVDFGGKVIGSMVGTSNDTEQVPSPGEAPDTEHHSEEESWSILRSILASQSCDSVMTPSFVPVIGTSEPPNDAFARLLESDFMAVPVRDDDTGEFIGFLKVNESLNKSSLVYVSGLTHTIGERYR